MTASADPTPWATGLLVSTFAAVVTLVAVVAFGVTLAHIHPLLTVGFNLVAVGGAAPTVWRWRNLPVWRWWSTVWRPESYRLDRIAFRGLLAASALPSEQSREQRSPLRPGRLLGPGLLGAQLLGAGLLGAQPLLCASHRLRHLTVG